MTKDNHAKLRIILDRNLIDVFVEEGQVFMPMRDAQRKDQPIEAFSEGGKAKIKITIHELESMRKN